MKKLFAAIAAIVLVAAMAVSMVACGGNGEKIKVIEIDLASEQYGVIMQKGDTEMKSAIDDIISKLISEEGISYNNEMVTYQSIYEEEMAALLNGEGISMGTVKKTPTGADNELVVATNADFAPFEYIMGDTYGGIDMRIAQIIADQLDKELVVVHYPEFKSVVPAVAADNADIGLAGLTINDEREEQVDFSVPYYDTTQRIAVSADDTRFDECTTAEEVIAVMNSLTNVKAGAAEAQTGYYYLTGNESFGYPGFSNFTTAPYKTVVQAVQDLANGKVDLVCADKDPLTAAVKNVND